jgi:hypothetical protein
MRRTTSNPTVKVRIAITILRWQIFGDAEEFDAQRLLRLCLTKNRPSPAAFWTSLMTQSLRASLERIAAMHGSAMKACLPMNYFKFCPCSTF